MTRILFVGTGLTNAVAGALLKQELPKAEFIMWDKAKGAGGRMSTSRISKEGTSIVDLGAQYITATPDYAKLHRTYYKELQEAGILTPLTANVEGMKATPDGTEHYVTPEGSSSLVKYYLNKTNSEIKFGYHVQNINSLGNKWEVLTMDGKKDCFDVVILSIPVPQVLGLQGQIKQLIETNEMVHKNLLNVQYSSRYALGLFFREGDEVELSNECCAQYISSDPVIRFVALDHRKRGRDDCKPTVVVHTSVPFGKANEERTPSEVEPLLVSKVKEMFPLWPEPEVIKCHKWKYSQVSSAYPGLPGAVAIGGGLIAGGDGFTHSNMDGCIESAKAIVAAVLKSNENLSR